MLFCSKEAAGPAHTHGEGITQKHEHRGAGITAGGGVTLGLIHFGPQYPSHMHNAFTLALSQSLFPLSVILKLAWDEVWVRHLGVIY